MIICLETVLQPEELDHLQTQLLQGEFVDGQLTAGRYAREVKHNQQLASQGEQALDLQAMVQAALERHPLFQAVARPRQIRPCLFSRYETGMAYGTHVDNALMSGPIPLRADLSFTLFLSDPHSYTGGELAIETSLGEQLFKLAAGSAILYPATSLHRVTEVTAGVRLAAVSWVQSYVRDPAEREILFDLETIKQSLFQQSGKTLEFDLLCKTQSNLLRKWMEL